MVFFKKILVLALLTSALAACGQKGALYMPTDPAAANRASLPQSLRPVLPASAATPSQAPSPARP